MYKFIIKDISGNVLYTSRYAYITVIGAQHRGHHTCNLFASGNPNKYLGATVEVIDNESVTDSVSVSPYTSSVIAHTRTHYNIQ